MRKQWLRKVKYRSQDHIAVQGSMVIFGNCIITGEGGLTPVSPEVSVMAITEHAHLESFHLSPIRSLSN